MKACAVIIEDEPLLRAELRDQLQLLWPELQIAGEAADGVAALALIDAQQPEIVFLDIQMPGLNGLEVAAHLPPHCQVVFVTAYAQHALAAFDAGAIDYLLKPLSGGRLLQTIRRLQARGSAAAPPSPALLQQVLAAPCAYLKWIKASTGNILRLILVDEIDYFQSEGKYTRVVSRGGEGLIRLSLKELLLQLNPAQFAQVHRSSIVNLHAVERIDKDGTAMAIRLKGGRGTLAVSEAYARQFRQM
ncbi:LytR/AlgR family response regulator transcription factor [Janthinobacterium sp. RB2R34]|uniref:LytR/AlgR family response regulator transcription factor n=1 Tax=Janthinobacterium sp. RB2R34 TaxID=3424193 RepID=UPI003F2807B7